MFTFPERGLCFEVIHYELTSGEGFASVIGGKIRKIEATGVDAGSLFAGLPEAPVAPLDQPFNIFVAGIGGTGVITIGALVGMAAHLEGKGVSLLEAQRPLPFRGSRHLPVTKNPKKEHPSKKSGPFLRLKLPELN